MKRLLLAAAIFASGAASVSAADLGARPYAKAPALVPVYNWTGFYIGGNVGGGVASSRFDDPCFYCSSATPTDGFFTGGAQVGYNYQFGAGLIGIEADVSGNSKFKSSVLGGNDNVAMTVNAKADVSGTIRARAGVVVSNALAYVTGGAAWAHVAQTGVGFDNGARSPGFGLPDGFIANRNGTIWGGVIGAGIEFAIGPNWTVGGEFLHTMYQDRDANIIDDAGTSVCSPSRPADNCVIRHQLTTDVARLRINYKFAP
jgi:opacity protein-like surface antigen